MSGNNKEKPILPHDHGAGNAENLKREVERLQNFGIVSDVFKMLSDINRLRIFWLLCHCEECVTNISAYVGMTAPAVSHHLKNLRLSGLIKSRRDGKEIYYTAADTQESRLLHAVIEEIMEIKCPK